MAEAPRLFAIQNFIRQHAVNRLFVKQAAAVVRRGGLADFEALRRSQRGFRKAKIQKRHAVHHLIGRRHALVFEDQIIGQKRLHQAVMIDVHRIAQGGFREIRLADAQRIVENSGGFV